MRHLRSIWHVGRWCTRKGGLFALWSLWLLLVIILAAQIHVFTSHEVALPDPVRRLIEQNLSSQGISLTFDRGMLDPSGRMLLENVRLGTPTTSGTLVTARSLHAKLKPWLLVTGRLDIEEISASGLDFHLPAMLSLSGSDETLANDIDFTILPHGRLMEIEHFTGRLGGLAVQAAGAVQLPTTSAVTDSTAFVKNLVTAYLKIGKQVQASANQLAALDVPVLDIQLAPVGDHFAAAQITLRANGMALPPFKSIHNASTGAFIASTQFIVGGKTATPISITGRIESLQLPDVISARNLHFTLLASVEDGMQPVTPRQLELQCASLRWRDITIGPSAAKLTAVNKTTIEADLSILLAGSPWKIAATLDPSQGAGRITLDGRVDSALLGLASGFAKRDLAALLEPSEPAPLNATATLLPGWEPSRVKGRLHSGTVRVGTVHLDETGTEFTYEGTRVLCDNLVLRTGQSLAHGLYEMNTATKDFRFILTGGLRPAEISGWFHPWWKNFWKSFDFSKAMPEADVDVAGRWGSVTATRVFVQAAGGVTGLHDATFDRVSTRLFIRPQWEDILNFKVVQNGREASGSFTRLVSLDKNAWLSMDFSVASHLPFTTIGQLLGKDAAALLEPYHFANAPDLTLAGHADGVSAPGGPSQHIDINLKSAGPASYHGFPLADLAFTARLNDGNLEIPAITLNVAQGRAAGNARVWGKGPARRIAFDATLTGANLGVAINTLAPPKPNLPPPDEKTRIRNQRLEQGQINLSLAAEGFYNDFHSFKGAGKADITCPDLGQLNLLGPLSELLHGTFLNFTSFSLNTLNAQFDVAGPLLKFGTVKVSGPRAAMDANGDYDLRTHQLDFNAKVYPFDESKSVVGSTVNLVLSPFSRVLEVKLQGTLEKPSWIFAYGPTRLLRTLTGGNAPLPAPENKPPDNTTSPAP